MEQPFILTSYLSVYSFILVTAPLLLVVNPPLTEGYGSCDLLKTKTTTVIKLDRRYFIVERNILPTHSPLNS